MIYINLYISGIIVVYCLINDYEIRKKIRKKLKCLVYYFIFFWIYVKDE